LQRQHPRSLRGRHLLHQRQRQAISLMMISASKQTANCVRPSQATCCRKELDRIASKLTKNYRGAAIRIEGHTDSDPIKRSKWSSNDALSQARADAVKKYLVSKGVSASRLESIGYGSSQPKGTKATSRRVEIVVTQ
jgi:flagellar motor protein MotB